MEVGTAYFRNKYRYYGHFSFKTSMKSQQITPTSQTTEGFSEKLYLKRLKVVACFPFI